MPSATPVPEPRDHCETLAAEALGCRACARVQPGSAVVDHARRRRRFDWLFVGEAPGRRGAGRTGVPFHGDEAGRRFELLLQDAGLERRNVFVTNAVLCLPLDSGGRNRPPLASEVASCSSFLARTIDFVQPRFVVAMGAVALAALGRVEYHGLRLGESAGGTVAWRGRSLTAIYHPGRQSTLHRPWNAQREDWRGLARLR